MKNLEKIIKQLQTEKFEGIIRRIDELGRLVIPIDYRNSELSEEITMYLHVIGEHVILSKDNENKSGMERTIDGIGRVTIKLDTRQQLNWNEKDQITVWYYNGYIIMKKVQDKCIFCRTKEKLAKYMGKKVCNKCRNKLIQV